MTTIHLKIIIQSSYLKISLPRKLFELHLCLHLQQFQWLGRDNREESLKEEFQKC